MRRIMLLAPALLLFLAPAVAQDQPAMTREQQDSLMAQMMAKWTEIATPGDMHKKLDYFVGVWETESRTMMGEPSAVTRGTAEYSWMMGGRYLKQDFHGEMFGKPMNGLGFTGYDNFAKKYVAIWIDDLSTGIAMMDGHMSRNDSLVTMFGKMDEWMTGELGKTVKYEIRILGPDRHVFEIHDMSMGVPNTKVMEITYTRRRG